ncbi:MAG: protein-L-isoaspartate O-methyltransferase family protein [Nocardioidaceae bacterium]
MQRAFAEIRRSDFLTDDQRRYSAEDRPLPIGHGQTNSQPTTVLRMLEWLDVRQADSVLDVGSGSGWTTALLGHLTGPTGRVRGVERVPELVVWGGENVASYDLPWVSIQPAESEVLGLPGEAPFDRILVSAQARHLPEELVGQLAEPGRMVIPVFGRMLVVDRSATGQVSARRLGHYAFVPLR